MSVAARPPKAEIEALERQLCARLGITPNATREELAAAYEAVQAYLASAPRDLRDWAKARSGEVDEAYALLSDPAALAGAVALVGAVERPAIEPGGPATPPARRANPASDVAALAEDPGADGDEGDEDDVETLVASVTPGTHRDTVQANVLKTQVRKSAPTSRSSIPLGQPRVGRRLRNAIATVGIVAAAVVVGVVGYNFGPGANAATQPNPSAAAASPSPTLDTQKVAALMQKIAADPKDTTSLLGLADAYFQVGDYTTAADWASKAVAADPKSVQGFVALGASKYNAGDESAAESAWKQAITLDPKNIEAHYDLGFLYFAAQPQDKDGAIAEWNKVIELDPTSDLATSLKAHLASLTGSPPPSGSVAPSSSPAASAAPSASAAASPTAGSSAQP